MSNSLARPTLTTSLGNGDPQKFAARLKLMVVGGKNLNDAEALTLAAYSLATGLNPFASECYYLPGIGPGPGIAGWRVKAEEQLEYEARKANLPTARFWAEYVPPAEGEARWEAAKGDIAVKAVLHDDITKTSHEKRILSHFVDLMKAGVDKSAAWPLARELAGPEPTWSAVGVVRGSENFGQAEKMDRYERACKRAEKAAIRKRFPRVNLPEPVGWDENELIEGAAQDITPTRAEMELLDDLGYTLEPEPTPAKLIPPPTPEPPQATGPRPYPPGVLKVKLAEVASLYAQGNYRASESDRKVLASALATTFEGDDTKRYECCKWLCGIASTRDMPDNWILAFKNKWLEVKDFNSPPHPAVLDEARQLIAVAAALEEAKSLLAVALTAQGQQELPL